MNWPQMPALYVPHILAAKWMGHSFLFFCIDNIY
jgi:hypothetical protein